MFGISAVSVSASENTTYTYTISVDNEWIRTQDAYMPGEVLFSGYGLSQPNDIFVLGRKLYVADTGHSRTAQYMLPTALQRPCLFSVLTAVCLKR